ncbi:DUF4834 family protein [Hymenobacter bucti]|uniref:DUF4834 family protein n=1 Tax=Hymenobacter bucti TaxID=1844114 RepID=A0ABW4QVD6_9BACT
MSFWISLLLFFLVVRYILPVVLRAALGGFVRQQVHKAQQGGFYASNGGFQAPPPAATPGQVRVDYVPPQAAGTERKHEFRGGEYVDYEEVK